MFDRKNPSYVPEKSDISRYIKNPLWDSFLQYMAVEYKCSPSFEFSRCGMEYGWNIKFRKSGRALCTVYPRDGFFTVMTVVGRREKKRVELCLPSFCPEIQKIYSETAEGNGQRWLMIDLEDADEKYGDVKTLLEIRCSKQL